MTPAQEFSCGDAVEIVAGDAKGVRGIVADVWAPYRTERQWVVMLADGGHVIREDYLERVEAL